MGPMVHDQQPVGRSVDGYLAEPAGNGCVQRHVFGATGTGPPAQGWCVRKFWPGRARAGQP